MMQTWKDHNDGWIRIVDVAPLPDKINLDVYLYPWMYLVVPLRGNIVIGRPLPDHGRLPWRPPEVGAK